MESYFTFLGSTWQYCCVYRSTTTAFLKSELALCLGEVDIFRWVPPRHFFDLHPCAPGVFNKSSWRSISKWVHVN